MTIKRKKVIRSKTRRRRNPESSIVEKANFSKELEKLADSDEIVSVVAESNKYNLKVTGWLKKGKVSDYSETTHKDTFYTLFGNFDPDVYGTEDLGFDIMFHKNMIKELHVYRGAPKHNRWDHTEESNEYLYDYETHGQAVIVLKF